MSIFAYFDPHHMVFRSSITILGKVIRVKQALSATSKFLVWNQAIGLKLRYLGLTRRVWAKKMRNFLLNQIRISYIVDSGAH